MVKEVEQEWKDLLRCLRKCPRRSPRGMTVQEAFAKKTVTPINRPINMHVGRGLNYKFMAAEALWILSGDNRLAPIKRVCKPYAEFSDDAIFMRGAYGPKVVDQLPWVIEKLTEDRESRQAVINIWRERPGPSKDVPCTLSLQFLIRDHVLHCVTTMRSSDAWLGWSYDVFTFSMIAQTVGCLLPYPVNYGDLYLTMGSSHLYVKDESSADMAINCQTVHDPLVVQHDDEEELRYFLEAMRRGQVL